MDLNKYLKVLKYDRKKVLIFLSLGLFLVWLNYTLTDAVNFNKIKKSETQTNHFLNNFTINNIIKYPTNIQCIYYIFLLFNY